MTDEHQSKHHRIADTHETAAVDFVPSPHVVKHVAIIHPLGNNAEIKQLRRITLDVQNVFVYYSPADGGLFAVFLGTEHL
jgi:hypothetical protein